jgi:DNA-directed RNA polymerase subunit RPC12/RpoP
MALILCEECGKEVSDKAAACPNCGAPIASMVEEANAPKKVTFGNGMFHGTKKLLVQLAIKAVQSLNWKVDSADEESGLVSFTTGMTWGSFSGVSGSIYLEEVEAHQFKVSGNAKQNVKGGQFVAFNIGNEAEKKVNKVIEEMCRLANE